MPSKPETNSHRVCPVWVGYLLASPIRALFQNPRTILAPYVTEGMRVMDVGCAMGFFSLPAARFVGSDGRVICVDVQQKMLDSLLRRARRANLLGRIDVRVCDSESLRVDDLTGQIDLALAFAVVHEVGNKERFFSEIHDVLRPQGRVLFAEPAGHVNDAAFQQEVSVAERCGLKKVVSRKIVRSHAVVLEKV